MKYLIAILFPFSAICQPVTVLFDLEKNETIGNFRNGYYLIDGKPGLLEANQKELIVQFSPVPQFDKNTHRAKDTFEVQGADYVQSWIITPKSEAEIYAEFKKTIPDEITKRQATLAMFLYMGIEPENIEKFIQDNIADATQKKIALIEWNYTAVVSRNNPLVNDFARTLNLSEMDIDNFFINASKL